MDSKFNTLINKYPKVRSSFYIQKKDGAFQVQFSGGGKQNTDLLEKFFKADKLYKFNDFPLCLVLTDGWNTKAKVDNIYQTLGRENVPVLSFSGDEALGAKFLIPDLHFFQPFSKVKK